MALTSWNAVSIVELVIYTHALFISIYLWARHGFGRNVAWIYLMAFTIIRVVGASLQLATIGSQDSIDLQTAVARLSYIGLSPLLLTTFCLLKRVNESIEKSYNTGLTPLRFKLIRIPIIIALILVIVGVSASAADLIETGFYTIQVTTKVGVALFILVFATIVLITGVFILHYAYVEVGQRRLLIAVAVSLPFIFVRLIYTILVTFTSLKGFSIIDGNVVAAGCTAVMEEMIVVMIYEAVGLTLPQEKRIRTERKWWRWRNRKTTEI